MAVSRKTAPPPLAAMGKGRPISLFLDFDGTLVELAPDPDGIDVPAGLNDSLRILAARLGGRLALVTGRALDDLEGHISLAGLARAGSHGGARVAADGSALGAEPGDIPPELRQSVRDYCERKSLRFEDKSHGVALHYRSDPAKGEAALDWARGEADRHGAVVKTGKCVIELVMPGADKGGAVRAFMARSPFADAMPVFVGDDVTDEDGFAAARELGGFGILVGGRTGSDADYRLDDVARVHDWLGLT